MRRITAFNVLASSALAAVVIVAACGSDPQVPTPPVGIGPSGGTFSFAGGAFSVTIPAGALSSTIEFTGQAATGTPSDPLLVGGSAYTIVPQQSFAAGSEPTITINTSSFTLPTGVEADELRLAMLVGGNWTIVTSTNTGGTITASLSSTGTYAIIAVSVATVTASSDSIAVDSAATANLTVTVKDADANTLPSRAVTWTSLDTNIATVSSSGVVTGVAPGNTSVVVTSESVSDTVKVTVNAVGGGTSVTPWVEDDFSSYTSIANYIADPKGIYTSEDQNTQQWSLVSPGYGSSPQALRYTYPDRTSDTANRCHDYTIERNLSFPSQVQEVWIEWAARFSSNFMTRAPGSWSCASNPDFKYMFIRTLPDSRFSWKNDTNGTTPGYWDPTPPGTGDGDNQYTDNLLHDGAWHVYRVHARLSTDQFTADGRYRGMIDGVQKFDINNVIMKNNSGGKMTAIYGFKFWANRNQGPEQDQELDLGYIRVYNTDPGWW